MIISMTGEQPTTSALKAHIEEAEEHALGSEHHAQLEATEKTVHQYIPVPMEIGLIVVASALEAIFIVTQLRNR